VKEIEKLNPTGMAVTRLIERGIALKLERSGVDYQAQRKAQAGFFVVGHNRDGNGRFRILSNGDTKPSQDLVISCTGLQL
jgi:hypothetical protein